MLDNFPYRENKNQDLTFDLLESKGYFDGIDEDDWDGLQNRLRNIENLNAFGYLNLSDLSIVGEMINLKVLDFNYTKVEDISWAESLSKLEIIRFNATPVRGFVSLAGLENLKEIRANQCQQITPQDIEAICCLPSKSLRHLHLRRTSRDLEPVLRRMRDKYYGTLRIYYDWSTD